MANQKIICTVITDPNYDQRMQRICTALAKNNYDVTLIGRDLPHSVELTSRIYKQRRLNLFFLKSMFFYAEYNIRLFFILLFAKVDIICSIDLDSILAGYLVAKLRRKTFVHDAHELFSEMPELDANPLAKKVWTTIEKIIFPNMNYAYTESEGYQAIYHKNYPNTKFEVIRNVPFYYKTNRDPESGSYILYQGALNVGRGLETAVKAMVNIDYELWLAGEGDVSQSLRELVKELKIEHKVKFLGWVKPIDLREITRNARIGINLLDPANRHYQLSFPNKLFDYIMAELPQVSMNFSYYKEIVQDKQIGLLIDDLEVETLTQAINTLLKNDLFYKQCVTDCKALKEIHNWEQEQNKLIDFYSKLPK